MPVDSYYIAGLQLLGSQRIIDVGAHGGPTPGGLPLPLIFERNAVAIRIVSTARLIRHWMILKRVPGEQSALARITFAVLGGPGGIWERRRIAIAATFLCEFHQDD